MEEGLLILFAITTRLQNFMMFWHETVLLNSQCYFKASCFFRHVLQVDNLKARSCSENYQLFHKQYSIGKFQEWYKKCCGRDGRVGLMRFMALLAEFCELSEHQAIQLFHTFDLYQNGRLDATDIYLIFSLVIANTWNLRVLFLHQHHTNIIPYLQLDTGTL